MWPEKRGWGTVLEFFLHKFHTNTTDMGGKFCPKSTFCRVTVTVSATLVSALL